MVSTNPWLVKGGITAFPYAMTPMNNITPLTYRDGITYLKMLEALSAWVRDTVAVEFQEAVEKAFVDFEAGIKNAEDTIIGNKLEWQTLFDSFMEFVVERLEALNDEAVTNLIKNPDSLLGDSARTILSSAKDNQKTFSVQEYHFDGVLSTHFVTTFYGAQLSRNSVQHIMAKDAHDLQPVSREVPSSFYGRTGANVIINASAWRPEEDRRLGLTIHNGVLVRGWEELPQTDWGVQSFVFFKDGHVEICKREEETPEELISRGAWNSVGFGKGAMINGVDMGLRNDPKYAGKVGRQFIGTNRAGAVVIITSPGITIDELYTIGVREDMDNLYSLDGGGSTQLWVNGYAVNPSSDAGGERPVPDCLAFFGGSTNSVELTTKWFPLTLEAGVTQFDANSKNDVKVITYEDRKEVVIRVNCKGGVQNVIMARLPREIMWPKDLLTDVKVSGGAKLVGYSVNIYGHITPISGNLAAVDYNHFEIRYTI